MTTRTLLRLRPWLVGAVLLLGVPLVWGCAANGAGAEADGASLPAPAPDSDGPERVTVRQLLDEPDRFDGREVRVSGRCLGWHGPAAGQAPHTRSDWQLEDDGHGIWVASPLPPGCSPTAGGPHPVTVLATVDVDSVADLHEPANAHARAFLVGARLDTGLPSPPPAERPR